MAYKHCALHGHNLDRQFKPNRNRIRGLDEPSVCRNIYGCRVGANPWTTAVDASARQHCSVCELPPGEKFRLLHHREFLHRVQCCPICAWLFGYPNNDGTVCCYAETKSVADLFSGRKLDDAGCPLCSFRPALTLEVMLRPYTDATVAAADVEYLACRIARECLGDRPLYHLTDFHTENSRHCIGYEPTFQDIRQALRDLTDISIPSSRSLFAKIANSEQVLLNRSR